MKKIVWTSLGMMVGVLCFGQQPKTEKKIPHFEKIILEDKFYAEGANYGDFNNDGIFDVVAGPFWYQGPDFKKKHEIYKPRDFNPEEYSDNFLCFVIDVNGDGWADVFICPHPGTQGYWYENPKEKSGHWEKHLFPNEIGNESPDWVEVVKGQGSALLYNRDGWLGYSTLKPGLQPEWTFHAVSPFNKSAYERYTHGVGIGDLNGDGRPDIIEKEGWWEQPANPAQTPWTFHPHKFAEAGAQMQVFDVDGDGLNDVVTAWHCHLYGLLWWRQKRLADGAITWEKNEILPSQPDLAFSALRISQMHALAVADINGDGLPDLLTGKRFWAHGSKGDSEADAPAVLYWFELSRENGTARFIPHRIDDNSGVGMHIPTVDLNGDGIPDIITANKKGSFVFLSLKQIIYN
jgi:hypothetical protein